MLRRPPRSPLFPSTPLFRSLRSVLFRRDDLSSAASRELTQQSLVDALAAARRATDDVFTRLARSEEHTSELQSLAYLVCRLLLEKKKDTSISGSSFRICRWY